jgi:hypothetical protein
VAARGVLLPGCGGEGCGGCGAPAAMALRWELRAEDPVFVLSSRCALQLVCVQSSCQPGTELACQWPAGASLDLNGKAISTPLPAAPGHSAPLLTASPAEFLTLQTNCLRLRAPQLAHGLVRRAHVCSACPSAHAATGSCEPRSWGAGLVSARLTGGLAEGRAGRTCSSRRLHKQLPGMVGAASCELRSAADFLAQPTWG